MGKVKRFGAVMGMTLLAAAIAHADEARLAVRPKVEGKVHPFPLNDVRLLDGPFKHAQDLDAAWLLKMEPDRLLSGFRSDAGLKPKAEKYGGWESQGVAGHCLGHHLSACAMMYASTGDEQFRQRVNYIVDELAECQKTNGNGYVSAIPNGKKIFDEVSRGDIRSQGFDLNGGWVPWYTTHKVMAGLRDAYLECDNERARTVLLGLADWALKTTDNLSDEQLQRMLRCEHGGMNEVAADCFAFTGDAKYLTLAKRFNHRAILDPLAAGRDELPGKHANTQIPKIAGCAVQYELTGDDYFRRAVDTFWERVVNHHSYVTGGNSLAEHFGPPDQIASRLGPNTTETCNTYNMLRVTRHLFEWSPDAKYMDYYERALLNHILASQNSRTGQVCYFVPLRSGSRKKFETLFNSFTCCVGTGMENHAKYGESVYFHDDASLYVNLFIPSELNWSEKGLKVRQETRYPEDGAINLTVTPEKTTNLALKVRHPAWAVGDVVVKVNGVKQPVESKPGTYLTIARTWQGGDVVEIELPMPLRTESPKDDPKKVAMMKGPVLLVGEIGEKADPALMPALVVQSGDVASHLKPASGELIYRTEGVGRPNDVQFLPFYQAVDQRYGVYWDVFTPEQWTAREAAYREEQRRVAELEKRTVDFMQPGEMQPERDHDLKSAKSNVGEHLNKKWRDAGDGGYIEFTMKVNPTAANQLVCTYWGSDAGRREFTVSVDGTEVARQKLENNRPGQFFDETYALPKELTSGKESVRVRLQPTKGNMAGGLFGCRVVKPE